MLNTLVKLFSGALAISPAGFAGLVAVLNARRLAGEDFKGSGQKSEKAQTSEITTAAGEGSPAVIAVIRLRGLIVPEASRWDEYFGWCGLNRRRAELDAALGDSRVKGVLFLIDSPGGSVFGIQEFSEYCARGTKIKPIYGYIRGRCESAAYWIASACTSLSISPSSEAGSIGVWYAHLDLTEMMSAAGVKVTLVHSGKYKVEQSKYTKLTEDTKAWLQTRSDETFSAFVRAVAKNRQTTPARVKSDFGEGRTFGAALAVKQGLCDKVETFESLVGRIVKRARLGGARMAAAESDFLLT